MGDGVSKPRRWRLLPTRCRARSPLGAPAPSSIGLAGIASTQNAGHHEKADHEPPPCGTLSFESECAHGRAERGRLRCWIQEETDFGWRQAAGCSRGTCARAASRLGEGDALQGRCSRVHDEESQLPARPGHMTTDSIAFGAASRAPLARQAGSSQLLQVRGKRCYRERVVNSEDLQAHTRRRSILRTMSRDLLPSRLLLVGYIKPRGSLLRQLAGERWRRLWRRIPSC